MSGKTVDNWNAKRGQICSYLGITRDEYYTHIMNKYWDEGMSAKEVSEYINQNTPKHISITPRSLQRQIVKACKMSCKKPRSVKDAYHNAIKRGRIQWHYKEFKFKRVRLSPKRRMEVLRRDGYKCVLCGATKEYTLLEVDHIVPICRGGISTLENLQTLCYQCNKGKQLLDNER